MKPISAIALAAFLAACGESSVSATDVSPDTSFDAVETRPGEVVIVPADVGDVLADTGPVEIKQRGDSAPDFASSGCEPGDGCFLDPCEQGSDCQSGWCVDHMGDGVCTQFCQEECPPGWACTQVAGTDPDLVFVCVSEFTHLCRPCKDGNDCKTDVAEDVCVAYGEVGNFCGGACEADGDCPWGFSCEEAVTVGGVDTLQCVADAGECPCTGKSVKLGLWTTCRSNSEWGTCEGQRVCTDDGLSDCDAAAPSEESCDGLDNDCDGEVDEPSLVEGEYISLCDDDNGCTDDACKGEAGCEHQSLNEGECMDGNPCTIADHCVDGVCVGDPVECEDDDPCTENVCTVEGGCEYPFNDAPCDDDDACTDGDQCQDGVCQGVAIGCECQADADCEALEDGNSCNGTLVCEFSALPYLCVVDPATVIECDDPSGLNAFCLQGTCDPATGECSFVPKHEGFLCDDADLCSVNSICSDGACAGGEPINCNDGNPCTDDGCDPELGCTHAHNAVACDDGDICTLGDACADGSCQPGSALLGCDDGNPCTEDSCLPDAGCTHAAAPLDGLQCDDENACTLPGACAAGDCVGAALADCDDGNVCTTDSCDPALGCLHDLNAAPCQDGSLCTINDACHLGECLPGAPLTCSDANPCTDDSCNAGAGCQYVPNNLPCAGGTCVQGECVEDCAPACAGKECGGDGCGGSCGECGLGHVCLAGGTCMCVPVCLGAECGDDGCGGSCGQCPQGLECQEGQCQPVCFPACGGKQCGDDGCGGSCGSCAGGQVCFGSSCCAPACEGKECGDDGCGGSCGQCPEDQFCVNAACKPCAPHMTIAQSIWGSLQFSGVKDVEVSPDGKTVYVSSGNSLLVAAPDPQSGELSPMQLLQDGHNNVQGVNGADGIAVSADGKNLYTARAGGNCIAGFTRYPDTGELKFLQYISGGPGQVLEHANDIAVSPDGTQVYAVSLGQPYPSTLSVWSRAPDTGEMTFDQALKDGQAGGEDLTGAESVAASPDGLSVYVAAPTDNAVTVFFRDLDTGLLGFSQVLKQNQPGLQGLEGARWVTVSPDGKTVQVTTTSALVVLSRDPQSGQLTHLQTFKNNQGISGLHGAEGVAISPDGASLYLAARNADTLTLFSRSPTDGTLTFQTMYDHAEPGFEGLTGMGRMAVSPGGVYLYLGGHSTLSTVTRDADTGEVTPLQTLQNGQYGAVALDEARAIAFSPGGEHAYVAAFNDHALVFERDPQSGALNPVQDLMDGEDGVDGLNAAVAVAVSPDGANVYYAANYDHGVSAFQRDPGSGQLTWLQVLKNGLGGVSGLGEPNGLTVSPDGQNVYVAAELKSVAVFARDPGDGQLAFVHAAKDGVEGTSGLDGAFSVAVSPDGKNLYAAAYKGSGAAFARDPDTGALSFLQNIGVSGRSATVTGDGKHVLVAAGSTLKVYDRDAGTGEITLLQTLQNDDGVQGLSGVRSVVVGPDGETVYTAADSESAVTVFVRDPAGGELFFYETVKSGPGGLLGPGAPKYLALSPGGEHLYTIAGGWGGGSVTTFSAWQCGE